MTARGIDCDFRATGQTGIMIAGAGLPIDCVVADFIAGAAEQVSPGNEAGHWDIIEGQGSLFNPAYAGVSLGCCMARSPMRWCYVTMPLGLILSALSICPSPISTNVWSVISKRLC